MKRRFWMGAASERRAANFINLVEKETHRSRAFAHVAGKFPENLVLGATRENGGVEFKVAPQFSLGLEFMHTDLGRSNDISGPQIVPGAPESYGVGLRSNSIMARFNYLFGR
jgi:hypothetical protein